MFDSSVYERHYETNISLNVGSHDLSVKYYNITSNFNFRFKKSNLLCKTDYHTKFSNIFKGFLQSLDTLSSKIKPTISATYSEVRRVFVPIGINIFPTTMKTTSMHFFDQAHPFR